MEVLRGLEHLPFDGGPSAVTVGFFDGVHLGHVAVFERTVAYADEHGLTPIAVTFDRHPREVLTPGREPRLLTTTERKIDLIAATGVRVVLVLPFTEEFSRVTAEDFVGRVIVEGLHAEHVVVGSNFTFGHRAAGTIDTLRTSGEALGFSVESAELVEIGGRTLSSSSIREALASGDLDWPHTALGRRYAVDGEVVAGAGRGTGLGYPTANLRTSPRLLLPGTGIYAGRALIGERHFVAAIDVGTNPTFGVEPLHVEAFLIDFEGDLRGEVLSVEFWERLRDELKFDSIDDLVEQMRLDVERTRQVVPPYQR
jgi:riboflavin kinase/FMN adenylyltransferase